MASGAPRLALFDLDHTLLSGDSDELWCEFAMQHGLLDRAVFAPRNAEMARRYHAATVGVQEFCDFYASTLAGRSLVETDAWCRRFLDDVIVPRIPDAAHALVAAHRERGERLVLTTATNRALTALTAAYLEIPDLIATELEIVDNRYTGRTRGVPNMRDGKIVRLAEWLRAEGRDRADIADATLYSDSSNDLPLLSAVGRAIVVDPDAGLRAHALAQGWEIVELPR